MDNQDDLIVSNDSSNVPSSKSLNANLLEGLKSFFKDAAPVIQGMDTSSPGMGNHILAHQSRKLLDSILLGEDFSGVPGIELIRENSSLIQSFHKDDPLAMLMGVLGVLASRNRHALFFDNMRNLVDQIVHSGYAEEPTLSEKVLLSHQEPDSNGGQIPEDSESLSLPAHSISRQIALEAANEGRFIEDQTRQQPEIGFITLEKTSIIPKENEPRFSGYDINLFPELRVLTAYSVTVPINLADLIKEKARSYFGPQHQNYIHPAGDSFIKSNFRVVSSGSIHVPSDLIEKVLARRSGAVMGGLFLA